MAYIYYIHSAVNTRGYIGQAQDNDGSRIKQHIHNAMKGDMSDGAARFIKDVGIANLQIKIYEDVYNYGLPENIWGEFFQVWAYNGKTSWEQCSAGEQLDLAEIMHIVWAKITGSSLADYNTLVGGFQNGSTLTLVASNIIKDLNLQGNYDITRFKINLRNPKQMHQWYRLTDPLSYLNIRDTVVKPLNAFLKGQWVWRALLQDKRVKDVLREDFYSMFIEKIRETVKNKNSIKEINEDTKYKEWASSFAQKLTTTLVTVFNDEDSTARKILQAIIRKNVQGLLPGVKADVKYSLSETDSERILQPLLKRINQLSVNIWLNIYKLLEENLAKRQKFSASTAFKGITRKWNITSKEENIKLTIPSNLAVDFKYKTSDHKNEAKWVQTLRNCKLGV